MPGPLGSSFGHEVGRAYKGLETSLDYVTHKFLHGVVGGGMGAILSDDPLRGALAGGLGAMIGEIIGEAYVSAQDPEALNPRNEEAYESALRHGTTLAELSSVFATAATGLDPNVASRTARTAVENNNFGFNPSLYDTPESLQLEAEVSRILWAEATKEIPECAAAREGAHAFVDAYPWALQFLPFFHPFSHPQMQHLLIDLSIPTTPLDVGLLCAGEAGAAIGAISRAAAGGAKAVSRFASGLRGTKALPQATSQARRVPGLGTGVYVSHTIKRSLEKSYPNRVTSTTVPNTGAKNVKLAGQRHPVSGIVFDQKGFPIFDDVARFETRITMKEASGKHSQTHMRAATRNMRKTLLDSKIETRGFTEKQLDAIRTGKAEIPGFTWHHHQDRGRMQLIPYEIHKETGHVGGMSLW